VAIQQRGRATPLIKPAEVQDLVRRLAREEWSGLYEIILSLHAAHPELSETARIDAVRPVLRTLLERDLMRLGWLAWPEGGPPMDIETPEAIRLLDDPVSWQAGERYPVLVAHSRW
jgi:hypothetical protein